MLRFLLAVYTEEVLFMQFSKNMQRLFAILFICFAIPFICFTASPCLGARIIAHANDPSSINVVDYGATGNGKTDDSQAFLKAWEDVCHATQDTQTLLIPKGKTFLLQPLAFQGPCKPSTINVEIKGTIIAPGSVDAWKWPGNDKDKWIQFSNINGLSVNGDGLIDGQGAPWWDCYDKNKCERPTALHFHNCENLQLDSLTQRNPPANHISINDCKGSQVSHLHLVAPADSPNTDGIDISESSNILIQNSTFETGDDCIAINGGSSFINITGISCGPGHGISIGSLGKDGTYDTVEEVHVRNCTFTETSNGARIKTWEGGSGYARKITYEDIILVATKNPVIIDQHYGPYSTTEKAVEVSDITFRNIQGTSAVEDAIQLQCDEGKGCTSIVLDQIQITSSVPGKETSASCQNAHGITSSSNVPKVPCLEQQP